MGSRRLPHPDSGGAQITSPPKSGEIRHARYSTAAVPRSPAPSPAGGVLRVRWVRTMPSIMVMPGTTIAATTHRNQYRPLADHQAVGYRTGLRLPRCGKRGRRANLGPEIPQRLLVGKGSAKVRRQIRERPDHRPFSGARSQNRTLAVTVPSVPAAIRRITLLNQML